MLLQLSDNLGLGVGAVPYLVLTFAPEWTNRQARAVRDVTCADLPYSTKATVCKYCTRYSLFLWTKEAFCCV